MTGKPCKVSGCDKFTTPKTARGMCRSHYQLHLKWGESMRPPSRVCVSCGVEFQPSGTATTCSKECARAWQVEYNRKWREENPDYHSEYNRRWREDHPEEYRAYSDWYRATYPDRVRDSYRRWEERNPDHYSRWLESNRETAREAVRRRRARLKSVPTYSVTPRDIRRLLERYRHSCAYCGVRLGESYHMDHVLPVTAGGSNGIGNLVPACQPCNSSKSNWLLSEWRYRDRLSRPLKRRVSTHTRK